MSAERPQYEPRKLACRECGGPLLLRDERTVMRTCEHCGALLELTDAEQRVLARRDGRGTAIPYRIELAERLDVDGASYEVIARVCVIEDGDALDQTHEYYLYHPRREPLWLSEYEGAFDLTRRTRVRPQGDVFGEPRYVTTYDGREWEHVERGETEVLHVEGALPFVQRRGDTVEYRELRGAEDDHTLFEATRSDVEVEYAEGRYVSQAEVESWLGRELVERADDESGSFGRPGGGTDAVKPMGLFVLVVAGLCAASLFLYSLGEQSSGQRGVSMSVAPAEADDDKLSAAFPLGEDEVVRVEVDAALSNAWMYAQVGLVEEDGDTVVHVGETEFGRYHGVDREGYSWSEGSLRNNVFMRVEEAGTYRLILGGASGFNEAPSTSLQHDLRAIVFHQASYRAAALVGAAVCVGLALFALLLLLVVAIAPSQPKRTTQNGWRVAVVSAVLMSASTAVAYYGCTQSWGAPELEHPDGVSIRASSLPGGAHVGFFAIYNSPRSHLGGGVHSGK